MGVAVPHAVELDKKYRQQGLAVVLVHVQDGPVDLAALMMKKFPSNTAMVTADNPVPVGASRNLKLPMAALIGVDGKILAVGHRTKVGALIDKLIPKELKKMNSGWGAAKEIAKARSLMHAKSKLTDAKKILDGFQARNKTIQTDLNLARHELELRFRTDHKSVKYLMASGQWIDAKKQLLRLDRGTQGVPKWQEACQKLQDKFDDYIGKDELKLDKAVSKIIAQSRQGVKSGMIVKMRKIVAKKEGLKVYGRAMWYISVWKRLTLLGN